MGLFGPNRSEIWRQVAHSLHGQFVPGGFLRGGDRVLVRTENGIITLDLHTESSGETSQTYTRLRAPFVNHLGHRLRIYRAGFFSELGKMLGTQDIELGDPSFDTDFMVQSRAPDWVKAVVDTSARRMIQDQERFFLEIRPKQPLFGPGYPEGVELLVFQVPETIKDAERLCALFRLLDHLLRRLETVGLSHLDPNARQIAVLDGPGGQVVEWGEVLWNGTEPRCRAAAELGRLQEPRAVPALVAALRDPDLGLRSVAIASLGQIGGPQAVSALVPLLGWEPHLAEGSLSARAADSLSLLGEQSLVAAFRDACFGRLEGSEVVGQYRSSFVQALVAALEGDDPAVLAGSATTLAQFGAVEAREALRARHRSLNRDQIYTREALDRAIQQLEDTSRLPRPAASPGIDAAVLPRPANGSGAADPHTFPVPARDSVGD